METLELRSELLQWKEPAIGQPTGNGFAEEAGFAAPDYVRWSYATSLDNIKEGIDRLEKLLNS